MRISPSWPCTLPARRNAPEGHQALGAGQPGGGSVPRARGGERQPCCRPPPQRAPGPAPAPRVSAPKEHYCTIEERHALGAGQPCWGSAGVTQAPGRRPGCRPPQRAPGRAAAPHHVVPQGVGGGADLRAVAAMAPPLGVRALH